MKEIKKLIDAIDDMELLFKASLYRWGKHDYRTQSYFYEIMGLKEAFKIVTGMTVVDYRLNHDIAKKKEDC